MPELPDVTVYVGALERYIGGQRLERIHLRSPFLVRSVEPDLFSAVGKAVVGIKRMGKRIVWEFEDELYFVFHLMIAMSDER